MLDPFVSCSDHKRRPARGGVAAAVRPSAGFCMWKEWVPGQVNLGPHRGRLSRVLRVAKGLGSLTGKMVEYERRKVDTLGQSRESQGTKHGNTKDWKWMNADLTCERLIALSE